MMLTYLVILCVGLGYILRGLRGRRLRRQHREVLQHYVDRNAELYAELQAKEAACRCRPYIANPRAPFGQVTYVHARDEAGHELDLFGDWHNALGVQPATYPQLRSI